MPSDLRPRQLLFAVLLANLIDFVRPVLPVLKKDGFLLENASKVSLLSQGLSQVTFECGYDGGRLNSTMSWWKEHEMIGPAVSQVGNFSIKRTFTLTRDDVGKKLECRVNHEASGNNPPSVWVEFRGEKASLANCQKMEVQGPSEDPWPTREKGPAKFNCTCIGNTQAAVCPEWKIKADKDKANIFFNQSTSKFHLSNTYSCENIIEVNLAKGYSTFAMDLICDGFITTKDLFHTVNTGPWAGPSQIFQLLASVLALTVTSVTCLN